MTEVDYLTTAGQWHYHTQGKPCLPLKYPDIWPVCCFILICWTYMVGLVNSIMGFIKMPDPCQINSYKHWQKSELAKLKHLQSPWIAVRSFLLPSYTSSLPPSIHIGPYTGPNSYGKCQVDSELSLYWETEHNYTWKAMATSTLPDICSLPSPAICIISSVFNLFSQFLVATIYYCILNLDHLLSLIPTGESIFMLEN